MAWLKAPMGAPSLPTVEILSFSYAALQPSVELLSKYLGEIDKLEKQGRITERDHQLLRSSIQAQEEMMSLTLGEEAALTEETITETLRRVSEEIKKEETNKLIMEQDRHLKTQNELAAERTKREQVQEKLFWRCNQRAKILSWFITTLISGLLLTGLIISVLGLKSNYQFLWWIFAVGSLLLIIFTISNLILGTTVKYLHRRIRSKLLTWCVKQEAKATGLDLRSFQ